MGVPDARPVPFLDWVRLGPGSRNFYCDRSNFAVNDISPCGHSFPRSSVGMRASASVLGRRGVSPLQARAHRPVTEGNCVAARRGGEQPEVNFQSATQVNSIRPCRLASLRIQGEACSGGSRTLMTLVCESKSDHGGRWGVWRRNGQKARHMKQRDLPGPDGRS
jgi:hypothetical protein